MREILFRGKAINRDKGYHKTNYKNGDWVYGLVTRLYDERFENLPAEMTNINGVSGIEVDYKTIGQYTGLTDKNGVRIFEGDILDVSSDVAYGGVAVYRLGYFVVEFHNGCFMKSALDDPQLSFFDNAKRKGLYHFISTDIHKIVGNIHDNPEILKGGGDNG